MTAFIKSKKGNLYVVLRYNLNGEWKQKWVSTGLKDKGNRNQLRQRLDDYIRENAYLESGIEGLKSKTGLPGRGNGLKGLHLKKGKTREEELELENLRLKIEVARLKKGYRVKGGGRGKEYVTTKGSNTKS